MPVLRRGGWLALSIVGLLALVAGCGGSPSNGSGGVGGAGGMSGSITQDTFVLPAGETRTVTGDLLIATTGDLTIAGHLLLTPGVSLALIAEGALTISGNVDPLPAEADATSRQAGAEPFCLWAGPFVDCSGMFVAPPGTDFLYTGTSALGVSPRLTISGGLICSRARDGRSREEAGQDGGDIELGTARAIELAAQRFSFVVRNPSEAVSATINGALQAGEGGAGFSDSTGVRSGLNLDLRGTDGGRGGAVTIQASEGVTYGPNAYVQAGSGGAGGRAVGRATDASGRLEPGGDLVARTGHGGDAGQVRVNGELANPPGGGVASSGPAGNMVVAAGRGGPGGRGGNARLTPGARGARAPGEAPSDPVADATYVELSLGARGGDADTPGMAGGDGGTIWILPADRRAAIRLVVTGYGGGGDGFNGCATTPAQAGTNGGSGGQPPDFALDCGPDVDVVSATFSGAFDGGRGGDGTPPGLGGLGGWVQYNGESGKVGADGPDGNRCGAELFRAALFEPQRTDRRLTYQYRGTFDLTFEAQYLPPLTVPGIAVPVMPLANYVGGQQTSSFYASVDPLEGLLEWGKDFFDGRAVVATQRQVPPFRTPEGLAVGDSFAQTGVTETSAGDAGNPTSSTPYQRRVTLLGFETVTVPQGTYEGCARLFEDFGTFTQTRWFAPDVGLVMFETSRGETQVLTNLAPVAGGSRRAPPRGR